MFLKLESLPNDAALCRGPLRPLAPEAAAPPSSGERRRLAMPPLPPLPLAMESPDSAPREPERNGRSRGRVGVTGGTPRAVAAAVAGACAFGLPAPVSVLPPPLLDLFFFLPEALSVAPLFRMPPPPPPPRPLTLPPPPLTLPPPPLMLLPLPSMLLPPPLMLLPPCFLVTFMMWTRGGAAGVWRLRRLLLLRRRLPRVSSSLSSEPDTEVKDASEEKTPSSSVALSCSWFRCCSACRHLGGGGQGADWFRPFG